MWSEIKWVVNKTDKHFRDTSVFVFSMHRFFYTNKLTLTHKLHSVPQFSSPLKIKAPRYLGRIIWGEKMRLSSSSKKALQPLH